MKRTYVFNEKTQKFVEITEQLRKPRERKSPVIFTDSMRPTLCHATGKVYDSRSEMRRDLKHDNSESIGWSERIPWQNPDMADGFDEDFEKAANDLRFGNAGELTELDKHMCKEIDRELERK